MEATGVNGTLSFDGEVIRINRDGFVRGGRVGHGEQRIALASVAIVNLKPAGAMSGGYVQFVLRGPSGKPGPAIDPSIDEHAVFFNRRQGAAFERAADAIDAALHHEPDVAPAPGRSAAERLAELADLHHQGLIDDAEHAAARGRIIDSI